MRVLCTQAIISNPPTYGHIHCAEKLAVPLQMFFTMPWSPTKVCYSQQTKCDAALLSVSLHHAPESLRVCHAQKWLPNQVMRW